MPDDDKVRDKLIIELKELREQVSKSYRLESEHKRIEEALQESQQMLQLVMDSIPEAIFWKDTNSVYLGCNKVLVRDVGLKDPGEIIGKNDYDLSTTREQSDSYREYDRQVMSTDKPIYHIIEEQRRPDNTIAWLDTNKIPLHDSDGNVIGVLCTYEDITERIRAEAALKESEEKYRLIVETTNQGICTIDAAMVITFVNKILAGMLDYSPDELIGRPVRDFVDESGRATSLEKMENLRQGMSESFEIKIIRKGGEPIWMIINAVPSYDKDGKFSGSLAMLTDITERKRDKAELERTNRRLKAISRCNETMIHAGEEYALLNDVCNIIVEVGGYRMAWIGYAENDDARTIKPVAKKGCENGYVEKARITWADMERGRGPTGKAIRSKEPVVTKYVTMDPDFVPWRDEAVKMGYNSVLGLPLISNDQAFGALTIYSEKQDAFDEDEIILLQELANNLAYGITSIRSKKTQEQSEEKLRESEARYRATFEQAAVGVVHMDLDGHFIRVNNRMCDITGYSREELLKLTYKDITYFEDIEKDDISIKKLKAGLIEIYSTEKRYVRKDSSLVWVNLTSSLLRKNGVLRYFISIVEDITERKRAEEEVKRAYAYNRSLIEASLDPLVTISPDGRITDVNLATERVTGYPREKLIGTDFSNYFTDPEKAKEGYLKVLQKGYINDYPLEIRHRYGHITPVVYNAAVYRDNQGNVIGIFAAARDITERKRVEEALEEAKNQAEIYLDLMGHDINNLNQIGMGYLELALDSLNLDQKGKELIAKPLEALENSSKLIDKVRKIQQVNTGMKKLYEVDVARLLRDLIPKYANFNGREVTINYVSGCHCFVMANDLLADVFSNILGNAVKHSSGPLIINVRVSKAEAVDNAYCKVTIEDNGIGIPDNMKKKLFSRFQRGNTRASGTGLGLYLVRSLVHYYNGYVWIEDSVPGDYSKGARFVVMIPVIEDASLYEKFDKKRDFTSH